LINQPRSSTAIDPSLKAESPKDLREFTKDHREKRIILEKHDIDPLLVAYEIHILAQAGVEPFIYATIQAKVGPKT
jgi:hypothetical protein